ncbi:MAG TPA: hypothetical protein PK443_04775 [bacterium]|nr:hypothetical protein [bacterium]
MRLFLLLVTTMLIGINAYTCTCSPENLGCFTLYADGIKDFRQAVKENRCDWGYIYEIVHNTKTRKTELLASKIEEINTWKDEIFGDHQGLIKKSDKNGVKTSINFAIQPERLSSKESYNTLLAYQLSMGFTKKNLEFIIVLLEYTKMDSGEMLGCSLYGKDVRDFIKLDPLGTYKPELEFNSKELNCY